MHLFIVIVMHASIVLTDFIIVVLVMMKLIVFVPMFAATAIAIDRINLYIIKIVYPRMYVDIDIA
jgi:hypothetical protein